jgi:hypothetical protein
MTVYANIAFHPGIWIDLPALWEEVVPDAAAWGERFSRSCWIDSKLPYGPEHLDYLAQVLTSLATRFGPGSVHPEHAVDPSTEIQTVLYLPDPRILPFPIRVMVFHENIVRAQKLTLRDLVVVDDFEAMDEPEVVEFEHLYLGTGLQAFRHRASEPGNGPSSGIFAVLKYAFPIPGHDDLLYITLSWPDLARIAEARDDIDVMVRTITTEFHPDVEAAASP